MKRFLLPVAGLVIGATFAVGANLPPISGAQWSEASQIVGTLNALITQLNGGPGYTGTAQNVSLGIGCTGTAAAATVVCSGQRGQAISTGQTLTAATLFPQTITNTTVTATSICTANLGVASTSAIAPFIVSVVPGAGSLVVSYFSTAGGAQTLTTNFICM